jgi:hypothetical protein
MNLQVDDEKDGSANRKQILVRRRLIKTAEVSASRPRR